MYGFISDLKHQVLLVFSLQFAGDTAYSSSWWLVHGKRAEGTAQVLRLSGLMVVLAERREIRDPYIGGVTASGIYLRS